jgi:pimeloyl-ACP methyl ester carboxylesterase
MTTLPVQVDEGTGPAIVLLHGLGNNFRSWTYVLEHVDRGANRVVAVDLLGFGDAEKPAIEYTPTAHAAAVIDTLDNLDLGPVVLAGHSMGCIVAATVARDRPDLVDRLVLLGAPTFARVGHRRFSLRRLEDSYTLLFDAIGDSPDLTMAAAQALDTVAPLVKGMEITDATWPAFRSSLRHTIMQTGTFHDLVATDIPTLLVYGHLDLFVIKRNLKAIARRNKRAVSYRTMLGPHEITPIEGEVIARLLQDPAEARDDTPLGKRLGRRVAELVRR